MEKIRVKGSGFLKFLKRLLAVLLVISAIMLTISIVSMIITRNSIKNNLSGVIQQVEMNTGAKSVDIDIYAESGNCFRIVPYEYHVFLTANCDNLRGKTEDQWVTALLGGQKPHAEYGYSNEENAIYSMSINISGREHPIFVSVTDGENSYSLYCENTYYDDPTIEKRDAKVALRPSKLGFTINIYIIAIVAFLVSLILLIYLDLNQMAKMAEDKKIAFYNECVKNGIKECKSEKEIQKVTLIAQKHKMQYSDVSILFYEAKASLDKDTANKKEAALNTKKDEERSQYNELNKYSNLKGRDKRIAILSAERADALESAKTLRAGAQAIMSASQQKEHDWAIHGGIASGIAGPAAGLAAAADIQAKNAQIRAQNEANAKAFAPIMMTSYSGAADHDRRARDLQEEIETTKIKLVSNDDAQTCLSKISFSNTKVEVSETGTCTVTTSAKLATPMIIFDDVEAIIDGTIIAKIYDGKTLVGSASLVLPKYGVKGETKLKGMCLYCGTKGKTYTVEYAATNLWAMER